jgi:indole-3-glycerol phosphate synthase
MSFLDSILKIKKVEVTGLRKNFSISRFEESEFFGTPLLSLKSALRKNDRLGIIAEIKKASPSKGILKSDFDFRNIASIYMENGVDAISILTDKNFFQGDIKYLNEIAKRKTIPLLRKDFIIDEYQVYEAKANGADAILLIAEALSARQIRDLTLAAKEFRLDVLLELHSEKQLDKIDFTVNDLIGINNRDLDTFLVDTNSSIKISRLIPENVTIVSESGFNKKEDVRSISHSRVKALLIGEHFMRSENIAASIKEIKEWCKYES